MLYLIALPCPSCGKGKIIIPIPMPGVAGDIKTPPVVCPHCKREHEGRFVVISKEPAMDGKPSRKVYQDSLTCEPLEIGTGPSNMVNPAWDAYIIKQGE